MTTFILASNNKNKAKEISEILLPLDIEVKTLDEAGIKSNPTEDGNSFEENALIKARCACKLSGLPTVADDSGLCVDALDGEPGIFSARYAENDAARIARLLREMNGIFDRNAKFVSSVACVFPDGREFVCTGICKGSIADKPRGEGGFGYDPVFEVDGYGLTYAQMPQSLKNRVSHRAASLEKFFEKLKEFIDKK